MEKEKEEYEQKVQELLHETLYGQMTVEVAINVLVEKWGPECRRKFLHAYLEARTDR
jgi:membrane protein required for beta-lactamase induction